MAKTVYEKILLIGGGATALDGIDGAGLLDGDFAFVFVSGVQYNYILDDDLGGIESSPTIITPDTNPGLKRWKLQGTYGLAITAGKTITVTQDTSLDEAVAMSSKLTIPGVWTTPAFDAAHFTGLTAMTWTVASGDVVNYSYAIIGKIMMVSFFITTSTVGGTLDQELRMLIPASKTATKYVINIGYILDNNVPATALYQVGPDNVYIRISRLDGANFTASTDLTRVSGSIIFEIN